MGGRNAMYFTSKRPEVVDKLVIVDIGPEISKRAAGSFFTPKLFSLRTRKLVRFLSWFG